MNEQAKWTDRLSDQDLAFIRRFVLASGSLKAIAQEYGISYPTVRLRLDRLIEKIRIVEDQQVAGEFQRTLRLLYAEGKIDAAALKALLAAHEEDIENNNEKAARPT